MNVSFGQPLFLWGIASVLWPLFLHFYYRKQRSPIPFPDLRFLKTMDLRGKGFRSIQRWWLLLLRMLALMFFFIGMSEPSFDFVPSLHSPSPLIFVDNHVGLIQGRRPEFLAEGKKIAQKSSSIYVVSHDGQEPNFPAGQWSQLPSAKQSPQSVEKTFPKGRPIVWVSDFSTSRELPKIPQGLQVQFRKISSAETDNLLVDSLWYSEAFIRKNETFNLHVRIKNTGTLSAENRHIALQLGDFTLNSRSINLAAKRHIDLSFPISLAQEELNAKLISNDPCAFDNTFYFLLRPSKSRQVIRISTLANADLFAPVFQKDAQFAYKQIHPNTFFLEQDRIHGLAIVDEFQGWSEETWKSLFEWVRQGNGVVFIPENQQEKLMIRRLNQLFEGQQTSFAEVSSLAKLPIRKPEKSLEFFQRIVQKKSFSEAWEMFSAKAVLSWQGGTSLMEFGNKEPFLGQFSVGNGRVFVFSSPMEQEFVRHGLFLPIFHEMALAAVREAAAFYRWEKSGFSIAAPAPMGDEVLRFQKEQEWIPEQTWTGGLWRCEWPNTIGSNFPGIYQVKLAGKKVGSIAVNYPKSASERATYSASRLQTHFPNASFSDEWDLKTGFWDGENGLARCFFMMAFLCLLAEMILLFRLPA